MSSVRLFALAAFARHGELHGHQLLLLAERENVQLWTDVSVGSLYQVIKRMSEEGLLTSVRTEKQGRYPQRRVYAITDAGREVLRLLQQQELRRVHLRPDPFDLALSRPDPDRLQDLPSAVQGRLEELEELHRTNSTLRNHHQGTLSVAEDWAFDHYLHRVEAEITWLRRLQSGLPDIVADEQRRARRGRRQQGTPAVNRP